MQNPGGGFETQREADGNVITSKVVLDLDNYALASAGAVATASTEFSADWPARGVINGDRTHINAGGSSVAENGIGGAVWQGNVLADGAGNLTPNESITIDLGGDKTFNRIKLIFWPSNTKNGNLGAIAPADYLISLYGMPPVGYGDLGYGDDGWGGMGFTPWTALVDKSAELGKTPTTISAGQVTGNIHDINVFESPTPITTSQVQINFSKLQSGSVRLRVCAIELTLAVDITEDVCAISRTRRKDYKLNRRLAGELNLSLINYDRKYSPTHIPTAAELAAGYFNPSIRPGLELRVFAGFGGNHVQMMTAYVDAWKGDRTARLVKVKARDWFKYLINQKVTTKLKSAKSIEYLVEFLANMTNFPSNMISLDTTTVNVAYYMPKDSTVLKEMETLGDATGDSEVYMDEFGGFHYRSYLTVVSHIHLITSAADFQAGTNVQTDAVTQPGALILANVAGVYYAEGNWYSTLSPVLDGKVQFTRFETSQDTGLYTSIDWFIRVTNDGGVTYTPWREIIPSSTLNNMSKWNHAYSQVQIWARLRTSNSATTPTVYGITLHYQSRGGSLKTQTAPVLTIKNTSTMLGLSDTLTDEVGGANYMITKSTVKSKPTFLSAGAVDAWIGTMNNSAISAGNPLTVPVGDTTFNVDFGDTRYNTPQTVVLTLGTAVATASLTSHPSKPVLTITATAAGTITGLKITGTPFTQDGIVEAVTEARDTIKDTYGNREDVLENDYIDNVDLATDISKTVIDRFSAPISWLDDVLMQFSPNLQINDRATVAEENADINEDFYIIAMVDELQATGGHDFAASTKLELVRVGTEGVIPIPAFYGSGGRYYFDNFRLGGSNIL